jgi:hypothetical protein
MPDDLHTVARYASIAEASIARNALDAAGIPAWIADELTLTADPLISGAVNYIKLQVRASDVEPAEAVLAEPALETDEFGKSDESDDFPPESEGERLVRFAYRAALMGLLACPPLLHIYSLVQLLYVAVAHHDLGPRATRQFYIALLLDLAIIAMAAMIALHLLFP